MTGGARGAFPFSCLGREGHVLGMTVVCALGQWNYSVDVVWIQHGQSIKTILLSPALCSPGSQSHASSFRPCSVLDAPGSDCISRTPLLQATGQFSPRRRQSKHPHVDQRNVLVGERTLFTLHSNHDIFAWI